MEICTRYLMSSFFIYIVGQYFVYSFTEFHDMDISASMLINKH